ncbi:MAG: hypothetical protein U0610_01370 [bacterium]
MKAHPAHGLEDRKLILQLVEHTDIISASLTTPGIPRRLLLCLTPRARPSEELGEVARVPCVFGAAQIGLQRFEEQVPGDDGFG